MLSGFRCPGKILAVTAFFKQLVECQQGTQIASFAECNDSFFLGVLIFIVHCKWKNISHGKPVQAAYTARKEDGPVANVRIIGAELEQGGKSIEED